MHLFEASTIATLGGSTPVIQPLGSWGRSFTTNLVSLDMYFYKHKNTYGYAYVNTIFIYAYVCLKKPSRTKQINMKNYRKSWIWVHHCNSALGGQNRWLAHKSEASLSYIASPCLLMQKEREKKGKRTKPLLFAQHGLHWQHRVWINMGSWHVKTDILKGQTKL